MKAVWLSSTYYLDVAVQNLSPNAERMLTRALAFCGNAESSGYLSELNITMLGLPNPRKLARELVAANIFVPRPGGGWDFRSWQAWNSSGDKLIARQKADRDRQARRRDEQKKSRDMSRDMSRDVTPTEERREEQNSGNPGSASPDPTAHEPRSAPVDADAWKLVRRIIPDEHPQAVRTELALQASALVKAGTSPPIVAEALELWLTKNLHPKTLPSLVSELINTRNRPCANASGGKPPPSQRKVNAALNLAQQFANQPPEQPALEAR